jgi:hypothetical protein
VRGGAVAVAVAVAFARGQAKAQTERIAGWRWSCESEGVACQSPPRD